LCQISVGEEIRIAAAVGQSAWRSRVTVVLALDFLQEDDRSADS
jgi:hypothetical protein